MNIFLIICGLGILANWIVLLKEVGKSPEGAMGMGLGFLICFIPWLVFGAWIVSLVRK